MIMLIEKVLLLLLLLLMTVMWSLRLIELRWLMLMLLLFILLKHWRWRFGIIVNSQAFHHALDDGFLLGNFISGSFQEYRFNGRLELMRPPGIV
jgi:hypothetical protein